MSVNAAPLPAPRPQFVDQNGNPLSGAKLFFYVAGSVNTKQNTYTDSTGATPNTNPIILNTFGQPATEIWFTAGLAYKALLAPSTDTDPPTSPYPGWPVDNLRGINDTSVAVDQWQPFGGAPTFVSTTQFTLVGDQVSTFQIGRRLKLTETAGTVYGRITNSAFAAVTTVTVTLDSGAVLDSGLSAVSYGLLTPLNNSIPAFIQAGTGVSVTYDATGRPVISAGGTSPRLLQNVGMTVTMNANAVSIALTDTTEATPSASSAAVVGFRSATIASGASSQVSVTAATTVAISAGSTGGTVSAQPSRIWVGAILVAGAVELAWFNALSGVDIAPINEGGLISTTAEGGLGAADLAQTWYSTTARVSVPVTIIGYFESTQATAGTWATSKSVVVVNPRYRPGDTVQTLVSSSGAFASGSTVLPNDDTIPQITEGDQYLSKAITPTSSANVIDVQTQILMANTATVHNAIALFQDATANALAAFVAYAYTTSTPILMFLAHRIVAATTAATTFRVRAGNSSGATTYFNGYNGGRTLGGVANSRVTVAEIMA